MRLAPFFTWAASTGAAIWMLGAVLSCGGSPTISKCTTDSAGLPAVSVLVTRR